MFGRKSNKLYSGVGDKGNILTKEDGKALLSYTTWCNMLRRCYSGKQASYSVCTVSDEWLFYPNFKRWFDENYKEGLELDKDLSLVGNTSYSGELCIMIPKVLNRALSGYHDSKGYCLIESSGKYRAMYNSKHIGMYDTKGDCRDNYFRIRNESILNLCNELKLTMKIRDMIDNYLIEV